MVGSAAYIGGSTVIGQSGPYSGATTQDLTVTGRIGTNGRSPSSGYPSGWWGGVHTWDLYAEGSIGVGQSGSLNAGVRSNGRIWTNEYIQISSVSTAGYGCSPNGLIGRDEYGYMLSCVNGVWTRAGGKNDVRFGSSSISGLTPGKYYAVSVYGIMSYPTNDNATLQPVKVTDSWGGVLAQTSSVYINWIDGNGPQSATMIVQAPWNGVIYGFTDRGPALNMWAFGLIN